MNKLIYTGAGILFWNKDSQGQVSVLLGKRKYGHDKGCWSIPGGGWESKDGKVKNTATLKRTAMRESLEEIFFDVQNPDKLREIWSLRTLIFRWSTFSVKCKNKPLPRKYYEFSKLRWFKIEEVPSNKATFLAQQLTVLYNRIK